ncbi:hypothetical protein NKI48_34035 [Mesorhizobium sp. M0644]|uniref:hypothetical protein n=1 Tax=Mesorhizobium sp. M0644 TaxID=2956979 RepID=UPI00333C7F19
MAELNRELRLDEAYEHGMEFIPAPEGARGPEMSGFNTVPTGAHDIYVRVAHRVEKKFDYSPKA